MGLTQHCAGPDAAAKAAQWRLDYTRDLKALLLILLMSACGPTLEPEPSPEPGSSESAATEGSSEVSFSIKGLFAHLCTKGPAVDDCLRVCLKDASKPWCGRFDEDCTKPDTELSPAVCKEWSARNDR